MEDKPDRIEKGIRFGCGTIFGLMFGVYLALRYLRPAIIHDFGSGIVLIGFIALVCGLLAVKLGDGFWDSL